MAWTAASIVPSIGSVVNRAPGAPPSRPGLTALGSIANPTGSSSAPAFLNNPTAFLGTQFLPYADLISRILTPQASPAIPPALAEAYAAQAQANTERLTMQNAATRAVQELPGQIQASRMQENVLAPWSLYGMPTSLGYQDPMAQARANTFNLQARQFGAPAISPINSGWLSPGLY